jgi:hypothetical protein
MFKLAEMLVHVQLEPETAQNVASRFVVSKDRRSDFSSICGRPSRRIQNFTRRHLVLCLRWTLVGMRATNPRMRHLKFGQDPPL